MELITVRNVGAENINYKQLLIQNKYLGGFMVKIINFTENDDCLNKYIFKTWLPNSKKDVFIYDRGVACLEIAKKCFSELGIEYSFYCTLEETYYNKLWSSNKESISSVIAFGKYICSDPYWHKYEMIGSYEDMIDTYNYDRNKIERIIKTNYNNHLVDMNLENLNFKKILNELYSFKSIINTIKSYPETWNKQNESNKIVNNLISYLESNIK